MAEAKKPTLRDALRDFIACVEATGGVREDRQGNYHPAADDAWTDLGDAYVRACEAVGKRPVVEKPAAYICDDCREVTDYADLDHPGPDDPVLGPSCPDCGSGRVRPYDPAADGGDGGE
jgi:hypothetical protein